MSTALGFPHNIEKCSLLAGRSFGFENEGITVFYVDREGTIA